MKLFFEGGSRDQSAQGCDRCVCIRVYAGEDLVVERGVMVGSHEANRRIACRVQRRAKRMIRLYKDRK